MAALFAAMLPRWFYLAMCFAPLAWIVLGSFALRIWGLDSLKVDVSTLFAPWQLPWLAVLATLAAAWRWRAIVRDAGTPRSPWRPPAVRASDRKSVGEGKRVSVRVDLGGSRIIKKKNKRNTQNRR